MNGHRIRSAPSSECDVGEGLPPRLTNLAAREGRSANSEKMALLLKVMFGEEAEEARPIEIKPPGPHSVPIIL